MRRRLSYAELLGFALQQSGARVIDREAETKRAKRARLLREAMEDKGQIYRDVYPKPEAESCES